ncbi:MAG: hypothetical protein GXP41_04965 [Chloroflexi bacterium]|nr:hypothetical protein [Chloroflexota bacterium]
MRKMFGLVVLFFSGTWGAVVAYRMSTEAITVLATGLVVVASMVVLGVALTVSLRKQSQGAERQQKRGRYERNAWDGPNPSPPVVIINPSQFAAGPGNWPQGQTAAPYGGYLPAGGASPAWHDPVRKFTVIGDE